LVLLRVTKEYTLDENKTTEPVLSKEMSVAPTLAVYNKTTQVVMQKSMVPNSE